MRFVSFLYSYLFQKASIPPLPTSQQKNLHSKPQQITQQPSLNLFWYNIENNYGLHTRDIIVPKNADINNISSIYSNGILYIEIPILNQLQYKPIVVGTDAYN